jgi:hypothetical protein
MTKRVNEDDIKEFVVPKPGPDGITHYGAPVGVLDLFDVAMRRPRRDFVPISQLDSPFGAPGYRLSFGSGNKSIEGFTDIDYPVWDAEKCEPVPYDDGTVREIICLHTLDHLSARAVQFWLADMQRILMPGGTINIVVPHHMSTLAEECIEHKTRYGLKTWRNILANPGYQLVDMDEPVEWKLAIGFNMVMGLEERNLVLVTQLVRQ